MIRIDQNDQSTICLLRLNEQQMQAYIGLSARAHLHFLECESTILQLREIPTAA